MVPSKEIAIRNQKYKSRRKIMPLRNKLRTIDEVSNESGSIENSIRDRESREKYGSRDGGYRVTKDFLENGDSESGR